MGESDQGLDLALFARLNRHGLLEELERRQAQAANLSEKQKSLVDNLQYLTGQLSSVSITSEERSRFSQERDSLEVKLYRSLPAIQPRVVRVQQIAFIAGKCDLIEFKSIIAIRKI